VWQLNFDQKLCPRSFYVLTRIYASVVSALVAVFFFLFLFFDSLAMGCSRILRISSSVIFLSVLNLVRSGVGGALRRVIPFLVTAVLTVRKCSLQKKKRRKLTNSGEQTADSLVVLVTDNLVLAENATTDTLDDTDLAGTLVLQLADREGEGTELLDNLGQSSS
jgi:hypothetical protein